MHSSQEKSVPTVRQTLSMHRYLQSQGLHRSVGTPLKDRHQWWGRELRYSLSLDMDKLFPKATLYIVYH